MEVITETLNENLRPLAINSLLDKQFFIPHYQRGYRWTFHQVEQLLDDIDSFSPREIQGKQGEKTFYCLQPVVVKVLSDDLKTENNLEGEWYELIDGQQRITTIYLIIQYINDLWSGRKKQDQFKIDFETRDNCVQFLDGIKVNEDESTVNINKDNIDFFHISSAYQTILNWELNYEKRHKKVLDSAEFQSKFLAYSKVIWYEVSKGEKSQALFERLNLGKIPLTNAELTKALFLSSNSFKKNSKNERNSKQLEIARLWDEIEHQLNDPDLKLWSFITNKKRDKYDTKIELILDLISGKTEDEIDPYYTFLKFSEKQKNEELTDVWLEIEHFYYTILQWSKDRKYYHKIGYLIAAKSISNEELKTLGELVKDSMSMKKDDFEESVDEQIRKPVQFEISELRYKSHSAHIFNALLLFNVETYRSSDAITEFYPFKQHKDNKWSLEHIHARNSENFDKTKKEPWIEWLELHLPLLKELESNPHEKFDTEKITETILEIEKYNNPQLTWERFTDLFNKVNDIFTSDHESMDRDSEGLSNLALLSQPDNSALNNSVFEIKKREIIKLDRAGSFIPICTRRVFMKYFHEDGFSNQYFFWSAEDRQEYYNEMKRVLLNYLPIGHIEKENEEDEDQ
jgi:uncharacterized protein with ParB-like and HNH nuclease domain